jgi:hypothetical protein
MVKGLGEIWVEAYVALKGETEENCENCQVMIAGVEVGG